ncbi:MAG: hypothetical protein Kow0069_33000 [Promethearchaeota archaeon]
MSETPDPESAPFTVQNYKAFLSSGKLMGSKCDACGNVDVPVRPICSKCSSTNLRWTEMSGNGKLAAFSCVHVGTQYFTQLGYSMKEPYCFGVVKLEEGPSVSAQIVGVDENAPETIAIGTPLRVKFLERSVGGKTWVDLGFEPA